jgi:hypothetical protein
MKRFRRHYGAGPAHLVGLLACFAVAAYAVTRVLDEGGWVTVFQWFVACLVFHDFIAWPTYTAADRLLVRAQHRRAGSRHEERPRAAAPAPVPWANHVRFPTVISAVLLGMFFPLIFRLSRAEYLGTTGLSENVYFTNWLMVSGALFAGSALAYLGRLGLARRRRRRAGLGGAAGTGLRPGPGLDAGHDLGPGGNGLVDGQRQ